MALSKARPGMRECAPGSDPGIGRTALDDRAALSGATRAMRIAHVTTETFGDHAQQHRRDGRAV